MIISLSDIDGLARNYSTCTKTLVFSKKNDEIGVFFQILCRVFNADMIDGEQHFLKDFLNL